MASPVRPRRRTVPGEVFMSTVQEIEQAIRQLTPEEFAELRAFIAELDHDAWDAQIEADAAAGRLDGLADEALRDFREGRCTEL
jgi:hypothetical protein